MTNRPDSTPTRGAAAVADRLRRLPTLGVFLVALAIGLAAFFTPGPIGALLAVLLAAGIAVLLFATWRRHSAGARALRLVVLGVLVLTAINKLQ